MIFCCSEPSRGLCVSTHQKRLKPGSNKNLYARSNFRSIISDSCTLKILDGSAWRQTCSERGTLVQQPWKTDLAANKEPLIYLLSLSFLYADLVFSMITRSWCGIYVFTFYNTVQQSLLLCWNECPKKRLRSINLYYCHIHWLCLLAISSRFLTRCVCWCKCINFFLS